MLSRASRSTPDQTAYKQLLASSNDLYLPWLCPALCNRDHQRRRLTAVTRHRTTSHARPAAFRPAKTLPFSRCRSRGLASPTAFDFVPRTDDHVPFENAIQQESRQVFQFPWMPSKTPATAHDFDTDPPLIINDSLTTRPPRFRSVDAISGEVSDLISTTKACVHVGRYVRAATLMRRLNTIYKSDAPALLSAHNEYIRELSWKIASTRDQQLLRDVQSWFEVDMRGQGIVPNALTYALLIQVSLQDVSGSKSNRSLRRYLHLAEEAGLKNAVNNAMTTVLNEQDLGRVTRVRSPEI